MITFRLALLVLAVIACLPPTAASAQSATGSIEGQVVDQSGAVLPGVSVTITLPATGASRPVVTDEHGQFRAPLLPPGAYDIAAELAGFTPRRQTGVALTIGQTLTLRIEMSLATLAENVVVTSRHTDHRGGALAGQLHGERGRGAEPAGERPELHRLRAADAGRVEGRAHGRHQLRGPAGHAQQPGRRRRRQQQHVLRSGPGADRLGPGAVSVQPGRRARVPGQLQLRTRSSTAAPAAPSSTSSPNRAPTTSTGRGSGSCATSR